MRGLMQSLQRFRRREDGATAIEFGLLAIPFFLIFLALFEVSLMLLGERFLQEAVTGAARAIRTGQATSSMELANFKNEYLCPRLRLLDCDKVLVEVKNFDSFGSITLEVPDFTDPDKDPTLEFSIAGASTVTTIRVFYRWKFHTPFIGSFFSNVGDNITRVISGGAVFRTEPYS
jgi:Flp pilus assembly protein TadG